MPCCGTEGSEFKVWKRRGTRKAFTYFFEVIKVIACKNALMLTKKMQNAPLKRCLCNLHPISFYKTILRAFLSTTTPFCSPLCVKNQACSVLGTGTKEDTEAAELAASGVLCLNHILNFLCMYLPQCHLSSCPMHGSSCGTFSRSSALQRLSRSSTTCLCGLYHLEGWLVCDVGRRVSKLARVRIAVQDSIF